MANEEMIQLAWKHILDYPDSWDQTIFGSKTECGTTYCLGGTAAVLSGRAVFKPQKPNTGPLVEWFDPDGNPIRSINNLARDVLGLTEEQADRLFFFFPDQYLCVGNDECWCPGNRHRPLLSRNAELALMADQIERVTGVKVEAPAIDG